MSYRTDYKTRLLKSTMVKTHGFSSGFFGTPPGPTHLLYDYSLGPHGAPTPKTKRFLKKVGNKKARRQHARDLRRALEEFEQAQIQDVYDYYDYNPFGPFDPSEDYFYEEYLPERDFPIEDYDHDANLLLDQHWGLTDDPYTIRRRQSTPSPTADDHIITAADIGYSLGELRWMHSF